MSQNLSSAAVMIGTLSVNCRYQFSWMHGVDCMVSVPIQENVQTRYCKLIKSVKVLWLQEKFSSVLAPVNV